MIGGFNMENKIIKVGRIILLFIYSLFLIFPFYMVLVTSIKPGNEIYVNPTGLPSRIVLENFVEAFKQADIWRLMLNSIFVTATSVIIIIFLNVLCSYGIYKLFNKKIGVFIYAIIMMGLMVPMLGYVSIILLYMKIHLYDNLLAVIIANVAGSVPLSVFLILGFLRTIPRELEEAAYIDGCSDIQSLWYVLVPVIRPVIATVAIFFSLTSWNNLLLPLLLIRNPKLYTIPLGLLIFKGNYQTQYNLLFAAAIVTSIPILILFLAFQDNFVESLSGSIKG